MKNFETLLADFDYEVPGELIAKEPVSPRDMARLLVFDRKSNTTILDVFHNILNYLPKECVLVCNRTKVLPAKITLKKKTGGNVGVLYLETLGNEIRTLASGPLKPGEVLHWHSDYLFEVVKRMDQEATLKPLFPFKKFESLLQTLGETPLPPYMKDSPLSEARRRTSYQTVFAKEDGSVAAPTAGLHFTKELIKTIERSGRKVCEITLHVGLGTFAPLTPKQFETGTLHSERYSIDSKTLRALEEAKKAERPIVAVGTTTVRALESASDGFSLPRPQGSTELFITEEYKLHFVDHLITNFHVPRSSLMMLVSAFTGRDKLLELYQKAVLERMRFFSFGDGMLII